MRYNKSATEKRRFLFAHIVPCSASVLFSVAEKMANVENVGEVYKCELCGNVVTVKEAGGGELVCCGEPMNLQDKE